MTPEQLDIKIKDIQIKYNADLKATLREYCDAKNPYKVGDTFSDHMGTIRVEKISYHFTSKFSGSACIYFGTELKKDGTPKVSLIKREAYQCNDINDINNSIRFGNSK